MYNTFNDEETIYTVAATVEGPRETSEDSDMETENASFEEEDDEEALEDDELEDEAEETDEA